MRSPAIRFSPLTVEMPGSWLSRLIWTIGTPAFWHCSARSSEEVVAVMTMASTW